jgi:hypothetical protein
VKSIFETKVRVCVHATHRSVHVENATKHTKLTSGQKMAPDAPKGNGDKAHSVRKVFSGNLHILKVATRRKTFGDFVV